jgi:hypothetical protein
MTADRKRAWLILAEAVISFLVPTYLLIWGVLTLPTWLFGFSSDLTARWRVFTIISGCLGLLALCAALRYLFSSDARPFNGLPLFALFAAAAVLGLWAAQTDNFALPPTPDLWTVLTAVLPTACTVHVFTIVVRRSAKARSVS